MRRRVRLRAALMLVLTLAGCAGWHSESVGPRELLQGEKKVTAVRVTRSNNDKVELYDPVLVGDSIRGTPTERAIQRITVPLDDIRQIESRRASVGRTALVILGVAGAVGLYALLQELNNTGY